MSIDRHMRQLDGTGFWHDINDRPELRTNSYVDVIAGDFDARYYLTSPAEARVLFELEKTAPDAEHIKLYVDDCLIATE